jgi:serine/threonine protein kinase
MVERNGNVRVLDLGLARFYDDHNDLLTLKYDEKNVLGTADYVAPEQALNSHEVDHRADIYSLGATFYFLLTGNPPFAGGRIAQKLIWHQVRQPTPVRQLRPEVPDGLAAVLEKMMAKDPDERYQTPKEVHDALSPWVNEAVPPPTEVEMPRLSPAAATSSPTTPGPGGRGTGVPGVVPRRSTTTVPIVRLKQSSGRVATLAHAPAPVDMATPRNLDAQTPTDTHPLRIGCPVAPSQLLQQAPATRPQWGGLGNQVVRLLVMAVISGVVGMAITWGFLMAR